MGSVSMAILFSCSKFVKELNHLLPVLTSRRNLTTSLQCSSFFRVMKSNQIKKDDNMEERLKDLSSDELRLEEDFAKMEKFVKTTMNFSVDKSSAEALLNHNKSLKALPFDKNTITLN